MKFSSNKGLLLILCGFTLLALKCFLNLGILNPPWLWFLTSGLLVYTACCIIYQRYMLGDIRHRWPAIIMLLLGLVPATMGDLQFRTPLTSELQSWLTWGSLFAIPFYGLILVISAASSRLTEH